MTKDVAKKILALSVANLQNRRGEIYAEDLEREVINNACLYILQNNINDIFQITSCFTEAALELFPTFYGPRELVAANMGIRQNIQWDGMWNFLSDYFEANHGVSIDNTESETILFYSTKHNRYENYQLVSSSEVERTINLKLKENELLVTIAPTLSAKEATLVSENNGVKSYLGNDPDYRFSITFDDFDEVVEFCLEMPNRNLRIEYYE
jgi:hypothetical protein